MRNAFSSARCVVIGPKVTLFEKLEFNMQEVRARGGKLYVLANHDVCLVESCVLAIRMADYRGALTPIVVHTVVLQVACHCAPAQ